MTPWDPMAVAVDWLDAYRAARINQIVGMHSPDAMIECACIASLKCPRSNWKTCRRTEA